jgi:hypothetical protein
MLDWITQVLTDSEGSRRDPDERNSSMRSGRMRGVGNGNPDGGRRDPAPDDPSRREP